MNSDFSFECIYDESIYIEELEKLLENIEKVLANPEEAGKILPMPKKLKSKREAYDSYYFETLKYAKKLLSQIIEEDAEDESGLGKDYIIDIM